MPVDQFQRAGFGSGSVRSAAVVAAPRQQQTRTAPKYAAGFALFLLVNAVLFIRPAELIPELGDLPFYELTIIACLAASSLGVVGQLSPRSLPTQPITVCVVGMLAAIVLSHLAN